MTRIIAGQARGRRLAVPPGNGTRPTSDRAREGLFSALDSLLHGLGGLRVIDGYAGSGAVGIEALSRGAAAALLIESDRRAADVMRANLRTLGLPGGRVLAERVERVAAQPCPDAPYGLLFLDPPYALETEVLSAQIEDFAEHGWLGPDAVVCVERASRDPEWIWPEGFDSLRVRAYGEGTLWYGHRREQ
ncbi:16S rRNA (guanine(966)-N(2))-methyltransferase RsmD [Actinospica durhamensis]|uniref:16S rRNA (Guanine(966)-N(2))-methyltransferase RsmD n=1 Tax=Actinospica durhamensis TaxID=1508375 RepID=A0A941ELF6_9ACTN|nr:16S rRNA (guanine(966)-N(2))-methyltransferase RsmD [Actinospica durhamensis]MBR7833048.1 16S rRNA (guanine(966)-N(2))-methyltransferase RsmD [Actinospica durhamensis]